MSAASKQDQLANCIADAVKAKLDGDLKAIAMQNTALLVTINAINARLATLESGISAGGAANKRQTRTAAGGAKKPAAKAGDKKGAASVTNALLFFRRAMAENIYGVRDEYATDENMAEADADPSVAKVDKTKEDVYYSAAGAFLWKTILTDQQKDEMRNKFKEWQTDQARENAEEPLEEEA